VIGALESDPLLPFDMDRLMALVRMEAGSWSRHREWITRMDKAGRGKSLAKSLALKTLVSGTVD
jgi:hypothetical protein